MMTEHEEPRVPRALVRRIMHPVRRVLAPAALEFQGQIRALREENRVLREELHGLRSRLDGIDRRMDLLDERNGVLTEGLQEARRLNLRVAELADIVTELVLPLHDRDIDASALRALRPEPG
jgi:hypothetical protein